MDSNDQSNAICHIQAIQMYPLQAVQSKTLLPFGLLAGEMEIHSGNSVDGLIVITNYRLYLQIASNQYHIPLGLVEVAEHKDLFYLQIGCKDARTYRCTFENNEKCLEWYDRIVKAAEPPKQLDQLFAFYHCVWSKESNVEVVKLIDKYDTFEKKMFENEMTRLQFEGDSWRISRVNENYKLCPSYPPFLLVPSCINDEMLESVAKFRSSRRIPAAVWRHTRNGAVIARCSQPEVGWLGWRSSEDEDLIKAISEACNFDNNLRNTSDKDSNLSHSPGSLHSDESLQITSALGNQEKKVLIMDARSYTTAVANRARGGGCECPEYYPNCEIQFMNLANIHSIRKSFHALRQLCTSSEQVNWFSQLEGTRWLQHMSGLMKAAVTLVTAVERDARPVLVHCSDGWDRTPQIVALAELLLDPFYRTIDGFRILIEREWLAFGHKFADRCGHSTGSDDQNERCPVFLQWLDCVHQILHQFPCDFEFTQTYLVKLAQHTYSNLYGTFLCNTQQERSKIVYGKTFSVWEFLNAPCFRNHLYAPVGLTGSRKVLWPQCNVRDLNVWSEMYLGMMEANFSADGGSGACPGPPEATNHQHMTKTRSFGDLINAGEVSSTMFRRSSDPNISDKKLTDLTSDLAQESNVPTQDSRNGHHLTTSDDDAASTMEDLGCNKDCMFSSNNGYAVDDVPATLMVTPAEEALKRPPNRLLLHGQPHHHGDDVNSIIINNDVINGDKTDSDVNGCNDDDEGCFMADKSRTIRNGSFSSESSDNEVTRLEALTLNSVETSTETLVSENLVCSISPKENGFEQVHSPQDEVDTSCSTCKAQSFHQNGNASVDVVLPSQTRTVRKSSTCSAMVAKQTPSSYSYQCPLGDDGLLPVRSVVQERLDQIFEEQKKKEEHFKRELQNLTKQICHKCNHTENDRLDDNSDSEMEASVQHTLPLSVKCPSPASSPVGRLNSLIESVYSAGEGPASAVESSCSDMSWETLEVSEPPSARWVPDHAVNRCNRCYKEFWFAKRKHHCRKCGNIFCADCSKNSTPLPSEQLFQPVRVCSWCYSELRKDVGELPNQCKQDTTQPTNNNPQITASSN